MILQVVLLVTTVTIGGERATRGVEFENIPACYQAAQDLMGQVAENFEDFGMKTVAAGCMIRIKGEPA